MLRFQHGMTRERVVHSLDIFRARLHAVLASWINCFLYYSYCWLYCCYTDFKGC